MNIDEIKNTIQKELIKNKEEELLKAKAVHNSTKEYSESDDLKQESKYDTRAIEANYLKDAQAGRILSLNYELTTLNALNLTPTSTIHTGALVDVMENEDIKKKLFISPCQSKSIINVDNQKIHIISYDSPLGELLMGLEASDSFVMELNGNEKYYEVIDIT